MPRTANNEDRDFTHYFPFNYQDLQTTGYLSNLGATNEKLIGQVPTGGAVEFFSTYVGQAAAGAADIVMTAGVTAAGPVEFANTLNISTLVAADYNSGTSLSNASNLRLYVNNTQSPVNIYMRISAGTIANLTAGAWVLAWKELNPRRFYSSSM